MNFEIGTGEREGQILVEDRWINIIAGGLGGGKQPKQPEKKAVPDPEDEAAKKKAAEERMKLQQKKGTGRTIATSPMGVLGAAPVSRPELKGTLG